jgi:hypothetical protein
LGGAPKNLNGTKDYALIRPGLTSTQQQIVTVFLDTPVGTYVVLRRLPRRNPGSIRDQQLLQLNRDHHGAIKAGSPRPRRFTSNWGGMLAGRRFTYLWCARIIREHCMR